MINFNFHQHTLFSDGKEQPEAFVKKAIELGFSAIGFSEHSPLPFSNPFSLKNEDIDTYISSIDKLKRENRCRLEIHRALEMDYVPGMSTDFDYWKQRCKTDYLIGSIHLVKPEGLDQLWFTDGPDPQVYDDGIKDLFGGDIKKAIGSFYNQTNQMIESQQFDVIGHFDKIKMHNRDRFFSDKDKWYRDLIDETISLIRQKQILVEINTRGIYKNRSNELFPDGYALKRVKELDLPIILSSDAHHSSELNGLFSETITKLIQLGFKEVYGFAEGHWQAYPLK